MLPKNKTKPVKLVFGLFGKWSVAGLFIGGLVGYVFYATIGCTIEGCTFISNPFITSSWSAILGFVVFEAFRVIRIDDVA